MNIDLNENNDATYVLLKVFLQALSKFGKSSGKTVKSIEYIFPDELTVVDGDDVTWKLNFNAEVKIPDNLKDLPNGRVPSEIAKEFCSNCDSGIKNRAKLCSVCEYLKKI